jgi:hypothetical protein
MIQVFFESISNKWQKITLLGHTLFIRMLSA